MIPCLCVCPPPTTLYVKKPCFSTHQWFFLLFYCMRNYHIDLYILFVIGTVIYLVDFLTDKTQYAECKHKYVDWLYIYLHHLISSSFMSFGWLGLSQYTVALYVICIPLIVLSWFIFGDCIMTLYINQKCNRKEFRDLILLTGLKQSGNYFYYSLVPCWFIALYRLLYTPLSP